MKARRRVLAVVATLRGGGAERVLAGIASAAAAAGNEVTVVTIFPPAADDYPLHQDCRRMSLAAGRSSTNLLRAAVGNLVRIRALRRVLLTEKPDVVLSFMDTTNVLTILAATAVPARVVVSERVDPRMYRPGFPWPVLRSLSYRHADAIVVQTERVAQEWARPKFGAARVHVIPNPLIMPVAPRSERGRGDYLLAVGRLDAQKGFDVLLRAYAVAVRDGLSVPLVILGEGSERGALETLVERLGLGERVTLPGRSTRIEEWYNGARAFVLSSRYEGFPNVLLEAIAHELPSVATDCLSGPAEILADGAGLLVPVDDVEALARSLKVVCEDEVVRQALRARTRHVAERYSTAAVMRQWEQVLEIG